MYICPEGIYCIEFTEYIVECILFSEITGIFFSEHLILSIGHFCRAGDNAPTKCSPLMRCPVGTADPNVGPFGLLLLSILLLYLIVTIGYKYIRTGFYLIFERIYGQTYAEWCEKNRDSKLLQYLGGLPRLSLSFNSANTISYSSVKRTIQTAFVSTEGDNDITIQKLEMKELPKQMTAKDGTDVIPIAGDDEDEEVEVTQDGVNSVGVTKVADSQPVNSLDVETRITRQSQLIRSDDPGEDAMSSTMSTMSTSMSRISVPGKCDERSVSTATSTRVLLNHNSAVQFTMDIEFTNLTMKLKSNNKIIVNKVSGRLPPGTITAVMGPSGSGKSSFLSALRGQAPYAKLSGSIKINGQEQSILDFADVVGYVPQHDIMSPYVIYRMLHIICNFNMLCNQMVDCEGSFGFSSRFTIVTSSWKSLSTMCRNGCAGIARHLRYSR